jgi:tripartite ATP-independent transporter DctP family solute receptor
MNKVIKCLVLAALVPTMVFAQGTSEAGSSAAKAKPIVWKYAHMNTADNDVGKKALEFSARVKELTNGGLDIQVYPNSQLGSIQEQAEMVAAGTVQVHHNTWGGLAVLMEKLELMDTPYLTKNALDAIKLNDVNNSPVLKELNQELISTAGVRIIGSSYGGSRMLTCSFPVYSPADLKGVKVRAIPSKVYITAVEGMGAIPIAVDWADTPTALATGVAAGEENPPSTIYAAKLYESQKYLMETNHIAAEGPLVVNEKAYQALPEEYKKAVQQAANELGKKYDQISIDAQKDYIAKLCGPEGGMTFITKADGLKTEEFKQSVDALVAVKYAKYQPYYARVNEYLGY